MPEAHFPLTGKRIWVAGHKGMVGSAIVRRLATEECEVVVASHRDLDLRRQESVEDWIADARPDAVIVAAARVGGIHANDTRPAQFLYDNLMIEANVIDAAYRAGASKLLFLGSSCIYPRLAPQPIPESALLTGALEPTNQWYAVAKIAGIKLCQSYRRQYGCDFISAMPTNLYGPGDNFDLVSSHVVPALMMKAHQAKLNGDSHLEVWGSGKPRRELLYVDDAADAVVHLLKHYSGEEHVNVGTGVDQSIRAIAEQICEVVGFHGALRFDSSKPDGTPRKQLDVSQIRDLGWQASTSFTEGLRRTYRWLTDHMCAGQVLERVS